jgi:hypothetical protein
MPLDGHLFIEPSVPVDRTASRQVTQCAEAVASTLIVLRRARDLITEQRRWSRGAFARSWFNIPVPPQSAFARRFCAVGAIMRAGRELRLRTQDACFALQAQTGRGIEDWNDDPTRSHTDLVAAFDAAIGAVRTPA